MSIEISTSYIVRLAEKKLKVDSVAVSYEDYRNKISIKATKGNFVYISRFLVRTYEKHAQEYTHRKFLISVLFKIFDMIRTVETGISSGLLRHDLFALKTK